MAGIYRFLQYADILTAREVGMNTLNTGGVILMSGIVIALLGQLYASVMAFKVSIAKGILCLIVPGYLLVLGKKHGFFTPSVRIWFGGVLLMAVGTVMLS